MGSELTKAGRIVSVHRAAGAVVMVLDLPKLRGVAFVPGQSVYWSKADSRADADSAGGAHALIGTVSRPAESPASIVRVEVLIGG